jgi:hypothetical protein
MASTVVQWDFCHPQRRGIHWLHLEAIFAPGRIARCNHMPTAADFAQLLIISVTGEVRTGTGRLAARRPYSAIMRSAHSTRETKMAGLPNFALQLARSFSETPRAREQAPQENTGMCLATIFSRNSLSGGQPMGITASDVILRIRYVASAVRNI